MAHPKDIWHFARPVLARQYLAEFDIGLIAARALFAKRRMGKSQFLERDLIPAAQRAGYLTPYLNLWQAQNLWYQIWLELKEEPKNARDDGQYVSHFRHLGGLMDMAVDDLMAEATIVS